MNTHIENTVFWYLSRGPSGVGVNELKRRLLISDPDRYGVTVPRKTDAFEFLDCHLLHAKMRFISRLPCSSLTDTTREKKRQESEGVDYHFVSVHMFEEMILSHRYSISMRSHGIKNNLACILSTHSVYSAVLIVFMSVPVPDAFCLQVYWVWELQRSLLWNKSRLCAQSDGRGQGLPPGCSPQCKHCAIQKVMCP